MSKAFEGELDVGAMGLLRKLTALQLPQKRNSRSNSSIMSMKMEEQGKNEKQQGTSTTSGVLGKEDAMPDWYEELDDDQSSVFKELFDMLDSSNTGTLNANSLYEGLRKVDSGISRQDVESVINTLDDDGNGEIDFNEFLFHMSQINMATMYEEGPVPVINDLSSEDAEKQLRYSKRQCLFYSAITRFSLKDALEGIERSYLADMRKPHVLSHFTAAERLIGLTDRQLAIQLKKMQHSVDQHNLDSPYAKPMMFVGSPKTIGKPLKLKKGSKCEHMLHSKGTVSQTSKPTAQQPSIEQEVKNSLRLMATRGSIVAKLPDIHLVAEINHTVFSENLKQKGLALQATIQEEKSIEPSLRKSQVSAQPPKPRFAPQERRMSSLSHTRKHERLLQKKGYVKRAGWTIPKIENLKVPLPVLKIKYKSHRPTMEDLPNIREKANQAINDYYENLRKTAVRNAWEHWDNLYADTIHPKKLPENFRTVYRAYSPHKEEEAFVVCPWIPGPFRHMQPIKQTQSQGSRYENILKIGHNLSPLRSFRKSQYMYKQIRPNSAF